MLSHLFIKDFTIITSCDIELSAGMTSMTGETGAGKSILIDALNLVLGDRADASAVRDGADRSEIVATFSADQGSTVATWLKEHDLDDDDHCQLRRVVPKEGKSRGYINGRPVSMSMLRTLGEKVIDIHGQHEHYALTQPAVQRQLLDSMLGPQTLLQQVQATWTHWQELSRQLEALDNDNQQRTQRMDMLRFQVREFSELALDTTELDNIENEHKRLANAGRLVELSSQALALLDDSDNSASAVLSQALQAVTQLESIDATLVDSSESINTALILCSEVSSTLRNYQHAIDLDPTQLEYLDQRLSQLHALARKHQCSIEELATVRGKLEAELLDLDAGDDRIAALTAERDALYQTYLQQSRKLSASRKRIGNTMSKAVTDIMQSLNMQGGAFRIMVTFDEDRPSPFGHDQIRFMVTPNPGIAEGELGKIASGGELSRISLAISLVTRQAANLPVLVFDEVDSGIGGGVAETVGRYLRELADRAQVLCVTHLPQVASQAHHHLQVTKQVQDGHTSTTLTTLDQEQRVREIARMLGGTHITEKSIQHAQEMLAGAGNNTRAGKSPSKTATRRKTTGQRRQQKTSESS